MIQESYQKTIGEPSENHRKWWFDWGLMVFHGIYPLSISYVAIENDHRDREFSHCLVMFHSDVGKSSIAKIYNSKFTMVAGTYNIL